MYHAPELLRRPRRVYRRAMALPVSVLARARLQFFGITVTVAVGDDGVWQCPRTAIRELLNLDETIHRFSFPGRVPGEAAHDLAAATVKKFGGRMLTRRAPIPTAAAGVVY